MSKPKRNAKYFSAYHGVKTQEQCELLCSVGFRKGTYFSFDVRDAIDFGGPWVLCVELQQTDKSWKGEPDGWQFWIRDPIPPTDIIWYGRLHKRIPIHKEFKRLERRTAREGK